MSKVSLVNGHIDGADTCVICGREIPEGGQVCVICGKEKPKKQTNYDRIRNMSVEKMVDLFLYNYKCNKCALHNNSCNGDCRNGIKQWLESEVDSK